MLFRSGLVGSITYLYLIFIRSSRKGYQKSRTTKKPSSKLVRTFCGPVTAVVLTIAMLAGETVYLVYAMRATRAEATASSQYISVSAHRGGARKAPENTMSATDFRSCHDACRRKRSCTVCACPPMDLVFLHGSEFPVPLAAQQLQRHPQYETASGFPDEDFQCLPGILDPGGADAYRFIGGNCG